MTLQEAISEAFGRTEYVRRKAWPAGSVGRINCLSENPFEPFSCTMGRAQYVSKHLKDGDLAALDWHACNIDGEQATGNWHAVLSSKDQAGGCIGRGDQCEVWLDASPLEGGCTLAWVKPHELSVRVARDRIAAWPDEGIVTPLGRLSISANGLAREFHLLEVEWHSRHDGSRLYRLCVAERSQVH